VRKYSFLNDKPETDLRRARFTKYFTKVGALNQVKLPLLKSKDHTEVQSLL
jgi:hypothetical protein